MRFSVLANGFPLPVSAVRSGNVLYYDLEEALDAVVRDLNNKTIASENYTTLILQRDFLSNLIRGAKAA